jgi:pimeloyl-ACP methyl ester carboxylesterase
LNLDRTHLVGLSFSGAIGLQLAADRPELVRTLTLIGSPPVHTPSSQQFRAANDQLIQTQREKGPLVALEEFLTMRVGADWRRVTDQRLPGSSRQMQRDASIFFDTEIPALLAWDFAPSDSSRITCPVLYIGGTDSGTWFDEVRGLMHSWFPDAEDVVIEGADHSLAVTHPRQIARALTEFLGRHQS